MRVLIGILIVVAVLFGGWKVWEYWQNVSEQQEGGPRREARAEIRPDSLEGMPYQLIPKLQEAEQRDAKTLKQFIETWRGSIKDPRLAWIELDYVNRIAVENPVEAKKVFLSVKQRVPTNSVIYPRIQALSKSYE